MSWSLHCHHLFLHTVLSQKLNLLTAPFRKIFPEAADKELVTKMMNSVLMKEKIRK